MSDRRARERRSRSRSPLAAKKEPVAAKKEPVAVKKEPVSDQKDPAKEQPAVPEKEKEIFSVDREKTCPLLLRVFCNMGRHHRLDEFSRNGVPSNELQIYTWMDCSLRELMSLIREVNPDTRQKGTLFSFSTVFPDARRGGYRMKDLGQTCSGRRGSDDDITLHARKFQIGDFIDVAISIRPRGRPY